MTVAGEGHVDVLDLGARSCFSPICTVRMALLSPVTTSGQRYWFQAARKENTAEGGQRRPGQGHGHPGHEPPVAVAVEGGRLLEVSRDLQERLAEQEGAEPGGQERDGQALEACCTNRGC